jgi:hypothetical protein
MGRDEEWETEGAKTVDNIRVRHLLEQFGVTALVWVKLEGPGRRVRKGGRRGWKRDTSCDRLF